MDALEEGKLSELFCAVLCTTVVNNDMHTVHTYERFLKIVLGNGKGCHTP